MERRNFLKTLGAMALASSAGTQAGTHVHAARKPNFVIVFTDDQGYADVGCFGAPLIKTPRLDRMASEGMRFTDFYSSSPVCTPSRASLMTGCYAQRVGLAAIPQEEGSRAKGFRHVLYPNSTYGLHEDETTMAELLKKEGYATACVGKWHLGHLPPFLPTRHGFDYYYGIPYSNDMRPCPIMRNEEVIEEPAVQETLTKRYTEEAVRFIREHRDEPFFVYLAHNMPHFPLHASEAFRGTSAMGLYGDVIQEIDWSVGQVLDTLAELGLDDNTVVVFTSDNGPWYLYPDQSGLATPLRSAKGTTYEGGMRVPCIMRWPGTIPAGGVCSELAVTFDLLPTFVDLAGGRLPRRRIIDGKDILPLMTGQPGAATPHEAFYYYFGDQLHAVRSGTWKLKFKTALSNEDIYRRFRDADAVIPESLYNLALDPGEQKNMLLGHRDVAERLRALGDAAREELGDSLTGAVGKKVRPIGQVS